MKDKILRELSCDKYVSGSNIGNRLGISRTAVWKHIQELQKRGYKIKTIKNKGYRLVSRPDIPYPEEIIFNLNTKIVGKDIFYFSKVDSTNLYAKKLIDDGVDEGTVVIANEQLEGRGRKKRKWYSHKGGLWFSIILYPDISPQYGMLISMASSVAVADTMQQLTSLSPVVKWPNDILINNRKICGILTEFDAEIGKMNYCIVGIGINVNNRLEDHLKGKATTLKQEGITNIFKNNFLIKILERLDNYYLKIKLGEYDAIRNAWLSYSNIINRKVQVNQKSKFLTGFVIDIDDTGCLILKTEENTIKISNGDLRYI